jgi:hypothetical protein
MRESIRCFGLALAIVLIGSGGGPSAAVAQRGSVSGRVLDADTREPLAGVLVTLAPRPAGLIAASNLSMPVAQRSVETAGGGSYRFAEVAPGH